MSTDNTQTQASPADTGSDTLPSGAPNGNTSDDSTSDGDDYVSSDVRAAMDFDPFTPEEDEIATQTTTNPDGNPSADGQAQGQQPASVTQVPAQNGGAPQQPEGTPDNHLQKIVEQNQQLLNAVIGNKKPDAQPETTPEDPWVSRPAYDYQVPDQLLVALNSEDPNERKNAVGAVMKGVSQSVHNQVIAQIQPIVQNLIQHLPQAIQQFHEANSIKQNVQTDFYGKYPQLNNPALKPIISSVATQLMQKKNSAAWTPELRDEIAQEVIKQLSAIVPQAAQPTQTQNPPAMFGGNNGVGTQRSVPQGRKTQQDHMTDLFD